MTTSHSKQNLKCRFCGDTCNAGSKSTMQPICKACRAKDKMISDIPLSSIAKEWLGKRWSQAESNRLVAPRDARGRGTLRYLHQQ